jgi:hypothetical protein
LVASFSSIFIALHTAIMGPAQRADFASCFTESIRHIIPHNNCS